MWARAARSMRAGRGLPCPREPLGRARLAVARLGLLLPVTGLAVARLGLLLPVTGLAVARRGLLLAVRVVGVAHAVSPC